jgi:ATP-dependent DNA helicase HFM1/MER3
VLRHCRDDHDTESPPQVFGTPAPFVACAPTGAGKTVLFELAVVRELSRLTPGDAFAGAAAASSVWDSHRLISCAAIYICPIRALCAERAADWKTRFAPIQVECVEWTGDTESEPQASSLAAGQRLIVCTTPVRDCMWFSGADSNKSTQENGQEKWDSITRKWREYQALMTAASLLLIDEVHLLGEKDRGPTLEAIVCRMKALKHREALRIIAVSATLPNANDVRSSRQQQWLHSW